MAVHGLVLPAVFPTGTVITKLEQTQTSTEDGGENIITAELFNGKKVTFKVRNGRKGGAGRINKVRATVDANVGTPEVTVKEGGTPENKELTLHFKNMKGEPGTAAGFGTPTASVDNAVGTPEVTVSATGPDTDKQFHFDFKNLKGDKGDPGDAANIKEITASVDNAVGTPEVTVSATGPDTDKQFHFDFKNLKGDKGDPGDAANIKEITASVDNAVGTPEVTVSATGEGRDKSVHFDFKNLKGDAGEKGGITGEEEERVVKKATDNAVRACHAADRMPLNPVRLYDFADAVTKFSATPFFHKAGVTSHKAYVMPAVSIKNDKKYKITANIQWTGDARPRIIVFNTSWSRIIYNEFINGVWADEIIIPANDNWCVGIWMHGNAGYKPKPDDSVTINTFSLYPVDNEYIFDASGNKCYGFIKGFLRNDPAVGRTFTPFEDGNFMFYPHAAHSVLWLTIGRAWTHSRWICFKKQQPRPGQVNTLWDYGAGDYGRIIFNATDTLTVGTRKDAANMIEYTGNHALHDEQWHHLAVTTNLQPTSVSKTVYLDGKKLWEGTRNGFFADWFVGNGAASGYNYNMHGLIGSLANLIIFDRALTEHEVSWLYHNPVYPNKKYKENIEPNA